jgi:hypothetical protein
MRQLRVIQLDDPAPPTRTEPEGVDAENWSKYTPINSARSNGYERRWREDDLLIIERQVTREIPVRYGVETVQENSRHCLPACVDFRDILEATTFEEDDFCGEPWANCDGYEHTSIEPDSLPVSQWGAATRGYYRPRSYNGHSGLLVLDDTEQATSYEYYRSRGASKQVARECIAANIRHTLDQLVEWYADGWQWYGSKCEFEGYEDSLWGVSTLDDEDYTRNEVASQVASQMQSDGYTILNWSHPVLSRLGKTGWTTVGYRNHLKRKMQEQNWSHG